MCALLNSVCLSEKVMQKDRKQQLPPLVPGGIATANEKQPPTLLGGYCADCGCYLFPRPKYCPQCLASPEPSELKGDGAIYSCTVVRTKPPFGLPQPYAVGFIDLPDSGLRIFGLLDPACIGQLAMGAPVRLTVGPLGHDGKGNSCLRPYFTLASKISKGTHHD